MKLRDEINSAQALWPTLSFYQKYEHIVVLVLITLIAIVIASATWHLAWNIAVLLASGVFDPAETAVFQTIFGMIFTVIIALEFKHSLLVVRERHESVVQVRTIVLIAILAMVRKFIILDLNTTRADQLFARGAYPRAGMRLLAGARPGSTRRPGCRGGRAVASPRGTTLLHRKIKEHRAMTDTDALKRRVKVCMFDQYGTVVDMQTGLWEVAVDFLKAKGWKGNPYEFVTWWRRTHFENSMIDALLHKAHTPYREIGHLSVAQVMRRAGIEHTMDEVRYLVSCIERLKPFPEVPAALARLQGRYKLAVLSNGDPDMLEAAKKHHRIPFDAVISVAEAGAFKPHVATYTKAAEILGLAMDEVLFGANHEFDCVGAKAAGMRAAFIDRRRRPFAAWPYQPDLIVPSMTALADLMV